MKNFWRNLTTLFLVVILLGFNNCGKLVPSSISNKSLIGTETGNAMTSAAIAKKACTVLVAGHPGLTMSDCTMGVSGTSFSQSLGVPDKVLNPYYTLVSAEEAGAIKADAEAADNCLSDFDKINPQSPEVQSAYNINGVNPYVNFEKMIPTGTSSCSLVYKDNNFPQPPVLTDPPGMITLDFDRVQPPGESGDTIKGIFGEIDFSNQQSWNWQKPFSADTTNSIYPSDTLPAKFSFATGPKIVVSIEFFAQQSGLVTVSDDQGQSVSMNVPADGKMHLLTTNFSAASSVVTVNFPYRWKLSLDNITYKKPDNASVAYYVQGARAYSNNKQIVTKFGSTNTKGNTIIAVTSFDPNLSLQTISDTQGNVYKPAGPVVTSPVNGNFFRSHFQVWYASDIKAGSNTVQVQFAGTKLTTSSVYYDLYIYEYAGIEIANPIDIVMTSTGTTSQVSSGNLQTNFADEMLFGVIFMENTDVNANPGFVLRNQGSYIDTTKIGEKFVNQTGSYSFTGTIPAGPSSWAVQLIGFKVKP